MAYSNWTFVGPGANLAQLNSTAPAGGLPPSYGTYCRKLEGLSGSQQMICTVPQTIDISPSSTVETKLAWLVSPGGQGKRFNASIRSVPNLINDGTFPYGIRGGGYGIGWYADEYSSYNTFWLDNFAWFQPVWSAQFAKFISAKFIVTGHGTYDEIELFQEFDSNGQPEPGGGIWQPVVFSGGFGILPGISGSGTTKITIQDWSAHYARPSSANGGYTTNTVVYWTGGAATYSPSSDVYIDQLSIQISNT